MDTPETLGRFRIERRLGRGALGVVHAAADPLHERHVAIKVMRIDPEIAEDRVEELRQRLADEVKGLADLSHANITTVHEAASEGDFLFIVAELVPGESLADVLGSGRTLGDEEIADLATRLGSALDHAHERGIVHRALKPSNVLLRPDGSPEIVDFGVARQAVSTLTGAGTIVGTPAYMSPEQITGHPVTPASDQFSLGVILYEALAGRPPFEGGDDTTVLYKIVHEEPPSLLAARADLPPAVDEVLFRALAKDPAERYGSCAELGEELRIALTAAPARVSDLLAAGAPARVAGGSRGEGTASTAARGRDRSAGSRDAEAASVTGTRAAALPLNMPTLLAVAAAIAVVVIGLTWVLSDGAREPEVLVGRQGSEPPIASPRPTNAAPASRTFRIVSRPEAAQVTLDGRVLAQRTPVEVGLDVSSRHTLLLEAAGRESVNWAFVPEELPEPQLRSGQLFFPLRDAKVAAAEAEAFAAVLHGTPPLELASVPGAPRAAEPITAPVDLEPYDPVKLRARDTPPRPPDVEDRVNPVLPGWAVEQGLQRYVVLQIVVDKRGRVRDARTYKAVNPELERLAHEAVLQWRFRPALRNGKEDEPVDAYFNLAVTFQEPDRDAGGS